MKTDSQALSEIITGKVNKGETIENAVNDFYRPANVRFAKDGKEALSILKNSRIGGFNHYCNQVIEFPVNNLLVRIYSYSIPLMSQEYVYVINIENLKVAI